MTLCFDEFNDLCKEAGATKPGAGGVAGGVAGEAHNELQKPQLIAN